MKYFILALIFPLAAILQSTLLSQAFAGNVTLDICLLLVIFSGFRYGAAGGSAYGLWAGTLVGVFRAWHAWPLALMYGFVGWLAGVHAEKRPWRWTYPLVAIALTYLLTFFDIQLAGFAGEAAPPVGQVMAMMGWYSVFCLATMFFAPRSLKEKAVC